MDKLNLVIITVSTKEGETNEVTLNDMYDNAPQGRFMLLCAQVSIKIDWEAKPDQSILIEFEFEFGNHILNI